MQAYPGPRGFNIPLEVRASIPVRAAAGGGLINSALKKRERFLVFLLEPNKLLLYFCQF